MLPMLVLALMPVAVGSGHLLPPGPRHRPRAVRRRSRPRRLPRSFPRSEGARRISRKPRAVEPRLQSGPLPDPGRPARVLAERLQRLRHRRRPRPRRRHAERLGRRAVRGRVLHRGARGARRPAAQPEEARGRRRSRPLPGPARPRGFELCLPGLPAIAAARVRCEHAPGGPRRGHEGVRSGRASLSRRRQQAHRVALEDLRLVRERLPGLRTVDRECSPQRRSVRESVQRGGPSPRPVVSCPVRRLRQAAELAVIARRAPELVSRRAA